ncbi:MAG: hypothetical protein AAGF31_11495, partial [Planctomycetota bacterium]
MSRAIVFLTLCSLSASLSQANGQEPTEFDDDVVWSTESDILFESDSPQLHDANLPEFRTFGRLLGGGYLREEEEILTNEDVGSIIAFQEEVTDTQAAVSLELMWQHFFNAPGTPPAGFRNWRFSAYAPGLSLDVGKLPLPAQAYVPEDQRADRSWRDEFTHVDYVGLGVTFAALLDRQENDFRSQTINNLYLESQTIQGLVGPQFTLGRAIARGPWLLDVSGNFVVGSALTEFELRHGRGSGSNHGESLIAGVPTDIRTTRDLGMRGELRVAGSYYFRKNWSATLIGRAFALGPWYDASDQIA